MSYTIKDTLIDLMFENNLTLTQLSEKIKIPYKTLSNFVKGVFSPSLKNAIKLADFFNCSLDYLVGLSNNDKKCAFTEIDNNFFARYQKLIAERNISHYRLCKDLDLGINISRKWKSGALPTLNVLIKLANYFGVSVDYLIGRNKIDK